MEAPDGGCTARGTGETPREEGTRCGCTGRAVVDAGVHTEPSDDIDVCFALERTLKRRQTFLSESEAYLDKHVHTTGFKDSSASPRYGITCAPPLSLYQPGKLHAVSVARAR